MTVRGGGGGGKYPGRGGGVSVLGVSACSGGFCPVTRLGLTQNLEPAREGRTFPSTGTLNGPSSCNGYTKLKISLQWGIS